LEIRAGRKYAIGASLSSRLAMSRFSILWLRALGIRRLPISFQQQRKQLADVYKLFAKRQAFVIVFSSLSMLLGRGL
jgi:hypothetical protein